MPKRPTPVSTGDLVAAPCVLLRGYTPGSSVPQFTTDEAPGAWRNGTKVSKVGSVPGDAHQDGARARVLGSIGPTPGRLYGYFVEWDDMPDVPTFIAGPRLALV